MDFHPRLEQPPKSQLQSPLSLPKNRQPNLAFLSGRLTSSSDLALSRSSSVQRFYGDVIAITSWAPDVVNLVRPICACAQCTPPSPRKRSVVKKPVLSQSKAILR